jgi:hypothetical protein
VLCRALELLASCPDGCTEALMLAQGFTVDQMVELVRAGAGDGFASPPAAAWSAPRHTAAALHMIRRGGSSGQ